MPTSRKALEKSAFEKTGLLGLPVSAHGRALGASGEGRHSESGGTRHSSRGSLGGGGSGSTGYGDGERRGTPVGDKPVTYRFAWTQQGKMPVGFVKGRR